MKKRFITFFICLIMACCVFACQPQTPPTVLVDFENETISINLGETFTLPSDSAYDENNNDYRVYYEVKTSEGASVSVMNDQFIATNETGYVITAKTQTLPDGTIKTRTITLSVLDNSAPTIIIDGAPTGYAGQEYTLPSYSATDVSSSELDVVVKLYFVDGDNETEVTVTDGKFTPSVRGIYRMKVTATDRAQNVAQKSVDIAIRSALKDFSFEDFDDELGAGAITTYENLQTEKEEVWHETFDPTPDDITNGDEREGVVEVTSTENQYGPHIYAQFPLSLNEVEFEYVSIRLYIHSEFAQHKPQVALYSRNYQIGTYKVNEWVEVQIDVNDIEHPDSLFAFTKGQDESGVECFKRLMTMANGNVLFWLQLGSQTYNVEGQTVRDVSTNYTFYIDEIGYKPVIKPTLNVEENYELGDTVTLNATLDDGGISDYSFTYSVTAPSGKDVTLDNNSFRVVEVGEYTVKVDLIHSVFPGSTTYTFNVTSSKQIEIGEFTATPSVGDSITIPSATIEGGDVTAKVSLYGKEVALTGNTFVANKIGTYVVSYFAEINGLTYKNTLEIVIPDVVLSNEVLGFDSQDDMQKIGIGLNINNPALTWLESYEGESGVVKASWTKGKEWPFVYFVPAQEMSAYADYEYIVFRIFVPQNAGNAQFFKLFNEVDGALTPVNGNEVGVGEWRDYVFDATRFKAEWPTEMDGYVTDPNRLWTRVSASEDGAFYIADISMANSLNESDFTITVTGEKTEGSTLALTYTAVSGAQVTLIDPEGDIVSDYSAFTAIAGEYTVEFTANGYFGKVVKTFTVNKTATSVTIKTETGGATVQYDEEEYSVGDMVSFSVSVPSTQKITWVKVNGVAINENAGKYSFYAEENEYTVAVGVEANVQDNEVISFDRESDKNNFLTPSLNVTYTSTWLEEYQGETGVMQYSYKGSNKYPNFTFTPLQSLDKYADYSYIVFRMYVSSTGAGKPISVTMYSDVANSLTGTVTSIVYDKWVDYVFDATRFKTEWNSASIQPYQVWFRTNASSASDEGIVYISNIYMTNEIPQPENPNPPTQPENPDLPEVSSASEVISFDSAEDISRLYMGANVTGPQITWLESYECETGVAKMSWTAKQWPYLYFLPKQAMSAYAEYDKIVFRMYFPDAGNKIMFVKMFNDLNSVSPEGYFEFVEYNKWIDFMFDATRFKAEWTAGNDFTSYPDLNRFWFKSSSSSGAGEFYIANIYMTKSN